MTFNTLTVWLVAIVVLLYAYVYVWSRGPRDGKLSKKIRGLQHYINVEQNRLKKKQLALVVVLGLFIISIMNPAPSLIPPAIGIEPNETAFLTAADGDVSSEGIGEDYSQKSRETIPDDILFYPDTPFLNDTKIVASSGVAVDDQGDSYTDTHTDDTDYFHAAKVPTGHITLNFTIPAGLTVEGFYWSCLYFTVSNDDSGALYLYNWDTDAWDSKDSIVTDGSEHTITGSAYDEDYWENSKVAIKMDSTDAVGPGEIEVDYAYLRFYYMTLADSDHYAESFAGISDITVSVGETVTTDDDLGTFHHPGDNAWDYYFWNDPSALAVQVIEWRCHANISSSSYEFALYSADDGGGSQLWTSSSITAPTSAATEKYSPMVTGVESIRLATRHASSPAAFVFDYLRGGLSTEAGWAHDGSTTAGIDFTPEAGYDLSTSSDSDIVTLFVNQTTGGADGWAQFYIVYDTTATATAIERDYYQFCEVRYRITSFSAVRGCIAPYVDGKKLADDNSWIYFTGVVDWTTKRLDLAALPTDTTHNFIYIYLRTTDVGHTITLEMDHIKFFSIANHTVTQSGAGTDDYLYTNSGVLYSHIDDGYIELDHDPALSVSDTYSVYNLTTSGTAPEFSQYVSSWSSYSDDTRGATTSGTVTDIKLKFDSTETISALKFIEDGTAPAVVRSSSTPNDPSDDEGVMLTAVVTDAVEVYKVYFDAIVSPAGFSDVPYYATEQTDNLWTYEFATLPTGPYVFKIVATDGANENPLTEYAYIELTVREAAITIEEITLAGAGSDFSMMTFSARINKDCSYVIYEESANNAESATHSGSVSSPSFNLAWTKLDTTDTNVNFTIKFTNSTLTYNYTSQYQVAFTTLQVTDDSIRTTASYAYLTGHVNLNANYTVYEETVQVGTGSVSAGSFEIRWTKASSSVENITVLFTSNSQTYPVYSGYDVAEQTTFVVEQWWVSLQIGLESYVEFYAHTSWENATIYVYDNTTLMVTVSELEGGASSNFWMSEVQGLHIITLNITHGATVHTRTKTYYIPDWAATGLVVRWDLWTFQNNYTMIMLESNWMNCTYYVYLNSSLVATSYNDPVTLNFTRDMNEGTYNLTIHAYGGSQNYTVKNIRYIVTEEGVSYDFSTVTGGVTYVDGDTYEGDNVTIHENPEGWFMDQGTAAIIAVGSFLVIFTAFLVARELKQRDRENREAQYSQ